MKKFLLCILLLFCSRAFALPFDEIIFFGDSLTDNGNLYKIILKILPKSPPYYNGRFSNGPTWAEDVGKYFYQKHYIGYKIYALGGGTVIYHPPTSRFISPATLSVEVNAFLLDAIGQDKSNRLYSIWIGGNDYLFDQRGSADVGTTKVVVEIVKQIKRLIQAGGKNFMVLNLPDLSKTPFARTEGSIPYLALASRLHNEKLKAAVEKLKTENPAIKIVYVNIYDIFNDVMVDPDKWNKKYNVHITNIHDSCWTGGYMLRNLQTSEMISDDVRKALQRTEHVNDETKVQDITQYILNSPELTYTYRLGKAFKTGDAIPCSNADEYLFWDEMHPTEVVHNVLSEIVIELLNFALPV